METTEIAKQEWRGFCDEFTKRHRDAAATLEVLSDDMGAQKAVSGKPFIGISYEEKGSEKGDITLLFGTEIDDSVEHRINNVARLWQRTGATENDDALEIEDAENAKTILRFP